MEYLGTTGLDSLKGADILKVAPQKYASTVKYPETPIARKLKGIAQVHFADLGSRIFYCDHGSFDTHAGPEPGPRRPVEGRVRRSRGLHGGLARARPRRQRHHPVVLGVRAPRPRQRLGDGPRCRRAGLHPR